MIWSRLKKGAIKPQDVDRVERQARAESLFIRRLTSDLETLIHSSRVDKDAQSALQDLLDEVRCSDIRGVEESLFYEEMLNDAVRKLKEADSIRKSDVEPVFELLQARNSAIRAWK